MKKYAYEYGKRWNAKVPRFAIARAVDRMHVSLENDNVAREIEIRIDRSPDKAAYTPSIRRQCIAYALERHKRNRALYARVMTGRL